MSYLTFAGRTAVITGAGRGIGEAHARLLAARGASVVINDLDEDVAEQVAASIVASGGIAIANSFDVATGDTAARVVQNAVDTFGRIDIVVNNAGIVQYMPFEKTDAQVWDNMLSVHLLGAVHVLKAAWPHMQEQRYGRIINTSSPGIFGSAAVSPYASAKTALLGLTNSLAAEGAEFGIQVNAILPMANTRMLDGFDQSGAFTPFRPEHVSPIVGWLTHEECDVTGEFFVAGGGYVTRVVFTDTQGYMNADATIECIRDHYSEITDLSRATSYYGGNGIEQVSAHMKRVALGN